tara:strand:+ start:16704 stop:16886 length:183 start_codon:yes stop_codon:yes gene_type:complete
MNNFNYDSEAPYIVNFNRWYHMNTVEREIYKQEKMPLDKAESTFKKMWGFKQLQEKVFVN